jgi:hypothetical protein
MNSPTATVRKIRKNFSSLQDVVLFMQMFSLVTVLPAMLKLLSIPRLMKLLTPRDMTTAKNFDADAVRDRIVKYADYILSRSFWIFKSTCLKRSLLLYHFLRRSGINVQICFGVRYKEDSPRKGSSKELEGHAWLLYKGEIFLERNAAMVREYTVTYCFPAKGDHASNDGLEFTGENP